ncbi:MAG: hypothetical protein AAFZ67_08500 [Planctomycetota bacterium]
MSTIREQLAGARRSYDAQVISVIRLGVIIAVGVLIAMLCASGLAWVALSTLCAGAYAVAAVPRMVAARVATFDAYLARRTDGLDEEELAYRTDQDPEFAEVFERTLRPGIEGLGGARRAEFIRRAGDLAGIAFIAVSVMIAYQHSSYRWHRDFEIRADKPELMPVLMRMVEVRGGSETPGELVSWESPSEGGHGRTPGDGEGGEGEGSDGAGGPFADDSGRGSTDGERVLSRTNTAPALTDLIGETIPNVKRAMNAAGDLSKAAQASGGDFTKLDPQLDALRDELNGLMNDQTLPVDIREGAEQAQSAIDTAQNAIRQLAEGSAEEAMEAAGEAARELAEKTAEQFKEQLEQAFEDLLNDLLEELMDKLGSWLDDALILLDQLTGSDSGFSQMLKDLAKQAISDALEGKSGGEILERMGKRLTKELGSTTVTVTSDGSVRIEWDRGPAGTGKKPFDPSTPVGDTRSGPERDGKIGNGRSDVLINGRGDTISPFAPSSGG